MNLKEYLKKYYPKRKAKNPHEITMITDYDRDVVPGSIFIAKRGYLHDGIDFIDRAIDYGAKTIFYDSRKIFSKKSGINYFNVNSSMVELARLVKMDLEKAPNHPIFIGVSGTCGKTSVTYLVYSYLKSKKYDCLLIGTHHVYAYYGMKEEIIDIDNTTPSQALLYKQLKQKEYDYDYVIMEVSSQGIMEHRILGVEFDVIAITNLSPEHLDYHHTFSEYKIVKGTFVNNLKVNSPYKNIILNSDDDSYDYFKALSLEKITTTGLNEGDIKAYDIKLSFNESSFIIKDGKNKYQVTTNLMGLFNVYNILDYYAILKCLKFKEEDIVDFLRRKCQIPGRMNVFVKNNRYLIVDYAHTSSAVENLLDFLYSVKKTQKLTTIIGAGGNRDQIKRSKFGLLSTSYSDKVIFTSDNPRDEDPNEIIKDMVKEVKSNNYEIIPNREQAIRQAYIDSIENEIILILGKGTEKFIIGKNNQKIPYSDIKVVESLE